jgi:hypothetical protein
MRNLMKMDLAREMLTCLKSAYLKGNVFEGGLRLKHSILYPPLRLEVTCIGAPYIWHASHAIGRKHDSIPLPHHCAIG